MPVEAAPFRPSSRRSAGTSKRLIERARRQHDAQRRPGFRRRTIGTLAIVVKGGPPLTTRSFSYFSDARERIGEKRGMSGRQPMLKPFGDFIKALVCLRYAANPKDPAGLRVMIRASRYLHDAIIDVRETHVQS